MKEIFDIVGLIRSLFVINKELRGRNNLLGGESVVDRPGKQLRDSLRVIECDKCFRSFGYFLDEVPGAEDEREIVPCPHCGWIQKHMVPQARQQHLIWLLFLGLGFVLVALCLGIASLSEVAKIQKAKNGPPPDWNTAILLLAFTGALVIIGLVMIIVRFTCSSRFNPNKMKVKDRIAWGRDLALSPKDFEKVLKKIAKLEHGTR